MHAKLSNGAVERYPYTLDDLRSDNPNTSFPAVVSDDLFLEFGVVRVVVTGAPDNGSAMTYVEGVPRYNPEAERWEQTWVAQDTEP